MQKYTNAIQDVHGNAVAGATIAVYLYGTLTPATIYSDNGSTVIASSSVTSDSTGEFYFYAANGRYTLSVSAPQFASEQVSDVYLYDPTVANVVDKFTATAGQTAFTLSNAPGDIDALLVALNGAVLTPDVDFTLSGVTLTLTVGAAAGDYLVSHYGLPTSQQVIAAGAVTDASVSSSSKLYNRINDWVSVKDFGAVGDGVADDSAAFALALASITAGVSLKLCGLTIRINQQNVIASKSNFEIDGEGATIIAASGMAVASDKELLAFRSCTDFTVKNLTVNGNRANRSPAEVPAHNIELRSCQRFLFDRVRSINAVVDGFILNTATQADSSTFVKHGYFIECSADNCYRQGMSVINAYDIVVSGGTFSNTNGTSPQAGIDIEANSGAATPGNAYILIQGASFSNNTGPGVITSSISSSLDVRIVGCSFSANVERAIVAAANNTIIDKCSFRNHATSTQGIITFPSASPVVTAGVVRDCTFGGNTNATPCVYLHSTTRGIRVSGNTIFDHVNGAGITVFGTNHLVSSNVIRGCGGIGVTNFGAECVISQNTIDAATGRGIYQVSGGAFRNKLIDNVVKNIASVVGGYIQSDDAGTIIRGNVCASTAPATTTIGIYLGASSTQQVVCENVFYNLHSTQPIGFAGSAVYNHLIHSNTGGTANEARTLLSGMGVPVYTTAGRPAASNVAIGQCVFNSTTLKPNWSNGTNWYNADGTIA